MRFDAGIRQRNHQHDAVCWANRAYQVSGAPGRLWRLNWHVRGRCRFIPALRNPVAHTERNGYSHSYTYSYSYGYTDFHAKADADTKVQPISTGSSHSAASSVSPDSQVIRDR